MGSAEEINRRGGDDEIRELPPTDLLEAGSPSTAMGHGLLYAGLIAKDDPRFWEWLWRSRRRVWCMVALLLGAGVSGVAWLAFGPPGLFAAGFLLSPILAPFLASIAANKLSAWRYRTRSDLGTSTTFFVFGHFLAGATLIVCIGAMLPSAWRSHAASVT